MELIDLTKYNNPEYVESVESQLNEIEEKKIKLMEELFLIKLFKILKLSSETIKKHIVKIKFHFSEKNWEIYYKYHTGEFNLNNYNMNSDSDDDNKQSRRKKCTIKFGCVVDEDNKPSFYIKQKKQRCNRFNLYICSN